MPEPRKLGVFLCHASQDKPAVRELYKRLKSEGWIDPWLDEENLYPGQDWDLEIEKAVEAADAVIVFLSNNSVTKEGYVQRELRFVLRIADFKPEGTVFVIPVRLEDCPLPHRLSMWQYVDYFPEDHKDWAYQRLLGSLKARADKLGIPSVNLAEEQARRIAEEKIRKEKEARERKAAEEKARKEKEDRERMAAAEQIVKEQEVQPVAAPVGRTSTPSYAVTGKPARKPGWLSYGIGGFIVAVLVFFIFGGNYIFRSLFATEKSNPTNQIDTPTKPQLVASESQTSQITLVASSTFASEPPTGTPTLAAVSTMVSEKDGMVMVFVPAGEFKMGSDKSDENEKPVHTVYLDDFWVDQTEVTNAMYAKCVQAGGCSSPALLESNTRDIYYGNPEFDDYPVIYVSWKDATAYCEWVGRRLPTEAEWEKAASWSEENQKKYPYPWGYPINCSLANYWDSKGYCVGDTTIVGSYKSGQSPYGVYDMAGNVWEWVSSLDQPYPYSEVDLREDLSASGSRVLRGGGFSSWLMGLRSSTRLGMDPTSVKNDMGFRCARGVSP